MQITLQKSRIEQFVALSEKFQSVLMNLGMICNNDRPACGENGSRPLCEGHFDVCQEVVDALGAPSALAEFEDLCFAFEDRIIVADGGSHRIAEFHIGMMDSWPHHHIAETAHHYATLPLQNIAAACDAAGLSESDPIERYADVLAENLLDEREIERLVCRMHREKALLVASCGGEFPDNVTIQKIAELTGLEVSSLGRYRKDWPRPISGTGRQTRVWKYDHEMRTILRRQFPHVEFPDSLA